QKLLDEHWSLLWGNLWDKTNAAAIEQMKKDGVALADASPALLAEIRRRLAKIETDWIADAAKKSVDGKAALAYMREQVRTLEKR
ncbi:MAG: hypothetical protein ACM36B_06780, partial [Bacteroidota bacterium]